MTVIMLFLLLLSLLGYSLASHRWLKLPIEFTPLFTITSMIMVMYIFGYIGQLQYNRFWIPVGFNPNTVPQIPLLPISVWLLFIGGLALLVTWCINVARNSKEDFKILLSPTIVIGLLGTIILFVLTRSCWFVSWDDVNAWSVFIREYYFNGGFLGTDSTVSPFWHYPNASPIWGNYISNILTISVPNMIFAQMLFQCAGIMVALRHLRWSQLHLIVTVLLFPYLFVNLLMYHGFFSILADIMIALVYAGIVLYFLFASLEGKSTWTKTLPLIPPLFTLLLIKEVGFVLWAFFIAYVLIESVVYWGRVVFFKRVQTDDGSKIRFNWISLKKLLYEVVPLLLLIAISFSAKWTWDKRIDFIGKNPTIAMSNAQVTDRIKEISLKIRSEIPLSQWWSVPLSRKKTTEFVNVVRDSLTEDERTIFSIHRNYRTKPSYFHESNILCSFNALVLVMIFLSLAIALSSIGTKNFVVIMVGIVWAWFCFIVYQFALLLAWMFAMPHVMGTPGIGGAERYPQTGLIFLGIILFSLTCYFCAKGEKHNETWTDANYHVAALPLFLLFLLIFIKPGSLDVFSNLPIPNDLKRACIERTEKEFPKILATKNYAMYCPLGVVDRIQLFWYPLMLSIPKNCTRGKYLGNHEIIPEPCDENFKKLDIEYYFLQCPPDEAFWERNTSFFTEGDEARKFILFKVSRDEKGFPVLHSVKQ